MSLFTRYAKAKTKSGFFACITWRKTDYENEVHRMCRLFTIPAWLVLSLLWTGAMFYLAYASWPQLPLDISPIDPATVEAMRGAILKHSLFYGLLGAGPPLVALGLGRILCARKA
jgi:hypothetical protein